MWQDYVFTAGLFIFSLSLLPTLRSAQKPSVWTSAPTAAVLYIFAITYASLGLWFSMGMQVLAALLWSALAVQRAVNDKRKRPSKD